MAALVSAEGIDWEALSLDESQVLAHHHPGAAPSETVAKAARRVETGAQGSQRAGIAPRIASTMESVGTNWSWSFRATKLKLLPVTTLMWKALLSAP